MYKLSNLAVDDFTAIYEYTLLNFGVAQADQYMQHLENTFHLLVSSPLIGYACVDIGEGIRRHDHHQHAIFYKKTGLWNFYYSDIASTDATHETFFCVINTFL